MSNQLDIFTNANRKSEPDAGSGSGDIFSQLKSLAESGVIQYVDYYFPHFLYEKMGETNPAVLKAAALLTYASRQGHVAIDLDRFGPDVRLFEETAWGGDTGPEIYGESDWKDKIQQTKTVGDSESKEFPLVLEGSRLYLRKFWKYELELANEILIRSRDSRDRLDQLINNLQPEDFKEIQNLLAELFPDNESNPDLQKVASLTALLSTFTLITGGPGTGKTFTVLRLLALLTELSGNERLAKSFNLKNPLRIAIAAPTGKAAARVRESVLQGLESPGLGEQVKSAVPKETFTIHRLLKSIHNSPHFRHNRENPLPYDVVIVDEASMVDLALMYKLVSALRDECRLVLLGDKDQLASVEAGAVLGDICQSPQKSLNAVSPLFHNFSDKCGIEYPDDMADEVSPLHDSIVELTESRRFRKDSGIGQLADAVNRMDGRKTLQILTEHDGDELFRNSDNSLKDAVRLFIDHYKKLGDPGISPAESFEWLRKRQILCGHKHGPEGSDYINREMEQVLRPKSGRFSKGEWFPGKVIMFTRNNYQLGLFNGDVGIALYNTEHDRLEVYVERPAGESGEKKYEALIPAQITECEPAWAITVHKSQGSEFDHILLVLPRRSSPVLTRELFYTALTRARNSFGLLADNSIIQQAVTRRVERSSGLPGRLWEAD